MDRRHFVKLSALGSVALTGCLDIENKKTALDFPIHASSNMETGHKIMKAVSIPSTQTLQTETLIIGGGIAGLSAANALNSNDFLLMEMDDELGGSSGAKTINGNLCSQGAHYDLSYPDNYGKDGLSLLEDMNVIGFDSLKSQFTFKDTQFLINEENQETCYTRDGFHNSPIKSSVNKADFLSLISPYVGEMKMPTRLIDDKFKGLNNVTFFDFLDKYLIHDPQLISGIDYQMMDDYGANCSRISALAGIHYYACRDYYGGNKPELFSPPEGNYYFVKKLYDQLKPEQVKSSSIIFHIERKNNLYYSKYLNTQTNIVQTVVSKNIIYAGQKNALRFIYPQYHQLFKATNYSAWVAINFELENEIKGPLKWQNDMLGVNKNLMGFVNSGTQKSKDKVLTMYLCFNPKERIKMPEIMANPSLIVQEGVSFLNEYFNTRCEQNIKSAHVKVMGHAMPIPEKGYLFNDRNDQTKKDNFYFSGVDNGRLPLMFEALDSGIYAANLINR